MKRGVLLAVAFGFASPIWAEGTSVVEKIGGAVKKGTEAAERGVHKAAQATERGLKKGGEAAAHGVGKAGEWVGEKMQQGGKKMQHAAEGSGSPEPAQQEKAGK